MWFDPDEDIRIDKAQLESGEPITTYRDPSGEYPALSECLSRIPWRSRSEGRLYESLAATDGYDRTTDSPELIDWYARTVGALKHDQLARKSHNPPTDGADARKYDSRESQIRERLRKPVIDGERVPPEEVYEALRDYRGRLSKETLEEQADFDCIRMPGAGLGSKLDLSPDHSCYAEYRAIRRFSRDGEETRETAGLGCTVDAAIDDGTRRLAVEYKTGARILQRHRAQASVQARIVVAEPVIVHLPFGGGAEILTPETDEEWHSPWRYWERVKAEAVILSDKIRNAPNTV